MRSVARFLASYGKAHRELQIRASDTEAELMEARQKLRATVQNVESGTRIMQTTAGAMRLMRRDRDENP